MDAFLDAEAERMAAKRKRDEAWIEARDRRQQQTSPRSRWKIARVAPRHCTREWLAEQPEILQRCYEAVPMTERPMVPTHNIECPTQDELDMASVAPSRRVEAFSGPRGVPGCERIQVGVPEGLAFAGLIHDTLAPTEAAGQRRMSKEEAKYFGIAHLDEPRGS